MLQRYSAIAPSVCRQVFGCRTRVKAGLLLPYLWVRPLGGACPKGAASLPRLVEVPRSPHVAATSEPYCGIPAIPRNRAEHEAQFRLGIGRLAEIKRSDRPWNPDKVTTCPGITKELSAIVSCAAVPHANEPPRIAPSGTVRVPRNAIICSRRPRCWLARPNGHHARSHRSSRSPPGANSERRTHSLAPRRRVGQT